MAQGDRDPLSSDVAVPGEDEEVQDTRESWQPFMTPRERWAKMGATMFAALVGIILYWYGWGRRGSPGEITADDSRGLKFMFLMWLLLTGGCFLLVIKANRDDRKRLEKRSCSQDGGVD